MSEINSIANGTFVLGNTSATTYQAGNGISITQPSEGTVRISNDETVLWSGELKYGSTNVPLSEAITNFERIRVITYNGIIQEYYTANLTEYFTLSTSVYDSSSNWIKHIAVALRNYNSNLYYQYNRVNQNTSYWNNVNDTSTWIIKVVGINRISGSNT